MSELHWKVSKSQTFHFKEKMRSSWAKPFVPSSKFMAKLDLEPMSRPCSKWIPSLQEMKGQLNPLLPRIWFQGSAQSPCSLYKHHDPSKQPCPNLHHKCSIMQRDVPLYTLHYHVTPRKTQPSSKSTPPSVFRNICDSTTHSLQPCLKHAHTCTHTHTHPKYALSLSENTNHTTIKETDAARRCQGWQGIYKEGIPSVPCGDM